MILLQYEISEERLLDHDFAQFFLGHFLHAGSDFLAQHFLAHGVARLSKLCPENSITRLLRITGICTLRASMSAWLRACKVMLTCR